jgi:hypothetical protein
MNGKGVSVGIGAECGGGVLDLVRLAAGAGTVQAMSKSPNGLLWQALGVFLPCAVGIATV